MKLNFTLNDDENSYSVTSYEIEEGKDNSTVVIPSTFEGKPVTSIGYCAFQYCSGLANVTIPDSVTSIGDKAFAHRANLKSITIPGSVTSIGFEAFCDCRNLKNITLENGVMSIGDSSFEYCVSLQDIIIPDSVTSIGDCAFQFCYSLTNITIPDSVTSIGGWAFCCCNGLVRSGKFKTTNADLMCRDYKFTIDEFSDKKDAKLCESGYHYCENAFDLFCYYHGEIGKDVRFFEVETEGESDVGNSYDSQRVCERVKLVREITSYAELLNGEER